MSWLVDHEAYGIPAPWPGIEPESSALEGEGPATGPAGKSLDDSLFGAEG